MWSRLVMTVIIILIFTRDDFLMRENLKVGVCLYCSLVQNAPCTCINVPLLETTMSLY